MSNHEETSAHQTLVKDQKFHTGYTRQLRHPKIWLGFTCQFRDWLRHSSKSRYLVHPRVENQPKDKSPLHVAYLHWDRIQHHSLEPYNASTWKSTTYLCRGYTCYLLGFDFLDQKRTKTKDLALQLLHKITSTLRRLRVLLTPSVVSVDLFECRMPFTASCNTMNT
jgi:hypothetical protein